MTDREVDDVSKRPKIQGGRGSCRENVSVWAGASTSPLRHTNSNATKNHKTKYMSIATTDFEYLASLIAKRTGNVVTASQDYLLESRLAGVVRELGLPSLDSLVRQIRHQRDHQLEDRIAEAMTINETSFFRDPNVFETLRDHIIPDLLSRRQQVKQLTIWCAACSSGQEPYTIAMLLKENFPELKNWNVKILCTDYSLQMVERTRSGTYTQFEVNRGLPAKLLVKYFDRQGMRWSVKDDLRAMMEYRTCNLTENLSSIPPADLVMLRNVLIYFDKPTKENVFAKISRVMKKDGFILLGGGETTVNLDTPFRTEMAGKTPVFHQATHQPAEDNRSTQV